jgi:FMNH2-dependent dimethyl sulfone monooxygenase
MKLALYLPNFRDKITVSELVDLAQLADELGFESIWTLERIAVPEARRCRDVEHDILRNYAGENGSDSDGERK